MTRANILTRVLVTTFMLAFITDESRADSWRRIIDFEGYLEGVSSNPIAVDAAGNLVVPVSKLRGTDGVLLWSFSSSMAVRDLALDLSEDVVFVAEDGTVGKVRGTDGADLWTSHIDISPGECGTSNGFAESVGLDGAGDVFVAGRSCVPGPYFAVVKLRGTDGAVLWHHFIESSFLATPRAIAVDGAGDAVAAGGTLDSIFTVVKLQGSDGSQLWRRELKGTKTGPCCSFFLNFNQARSVVVDQVGDAIAAGFVENEGTDLDFAVVKLASGSGVELWRYTLNGTANDEDSAFQVAVEPGGDLLVSGNVKNIEGPAFAMVKIAGATGSELWRRELRGTSRRGAGELTSIAIDGMGNVLAGGRIDNKRSDNDLLLLKFRGTDGAELWRRVLAGPFDSQDRLGGVAIDPSGDVFAYGIPGDRIALKVDGLTGSDAQITGDALLVVDNSNDPTKRRIFIRSKERSNESRLIQRPAPGNPGDPTTGGGSLQIRNPTTGETDSFPLPAANWKGLGKPPGSKGYKYGDRAQVAGPCKKLTLKRGKLKAVCLGPGIDYSLDEPSQVSIAVSLFTGPGNFQNCMLFGGEIVADSPSGGGGVGIFRAEAAPVPPSCSASSPSGAFLDVRTGILE
jgi:outer membrane protein assembly factor BamB